MRTTIAGTAEMNSKGRAAMVELAVEPQRVKEPQEHQGYGAGPQTQEATLTGTEYLHCQPPMRFLSLWTYSALKQSLIMAGLALVLSFAAGMVSQAAPWHCASDLVMSCNFLYLQFFCR